MKSSHRDAKFKNMGWLDELFKGCCGIFLVGFLVVDVFMTLLFSSSDSFFSIAVTFIISSLVLFIILSPFIVLGGIIHVSLKDYRDKK